LRIDLIPVTVPAAMKKDPQNLKIRVVMKPTATATAPDQYRTNWARVALITVPVLLLGLLAAKFLFDEPSAPPSSGLALDNRLDTPVKNNNAIAPIPTPEPETREASPPQPAPAIADLKDIEDVEIVEGVEDGDQTPDSQQPDRRPGEPAFTVEASPVEASPQLAPATAPDDISVPEVSTSQAAASPPPAASLPSSQAVTTLQAGETRIISPNVKRFQLAEGIRNKEPHGVLADINDSDSADGVLTVYAFAEVLNMKDNKIQYRWLRNGKQAANVKVGVWSNKYRSHSSKYITLGMRGDWQVRLENSQGELLAEAAFHY
jgi:hypothetical protein